MNSEQAFETLSAAVSAAVNETLARNSQAALRGDVEALQTESDLLDKLVRARSQLQDLRDTWPLLGEGRPAASPAQPPEPGLAGQRTPQTAFYLPILQVLAEMGGRAAASDVLETVGEIMADQLTDHDFARLESGAIRWRNTAHAARYAMKQRGLIADNSPIGTWEITPEGRAYLGDQRA